MADAVNDMICIIQCIRWMIHFTVIFNRSKYGAIARSEIYLDCNFFICNNCICFNVKIYICIKPVTVIFLDFKKKMQACISKSESRFLEFEVTGDERIQKVLNVIF